MATTLLSAGITMGSSTLQPGGSAPSYTARAWVSFDGTLSSPISSRGSGNVSTVTRFATGFYSVTFATAMQDVNYAYSHAYSSEVNNTHTVGFLHSISSSQLSVGHYDVNNSFNGANKSWVIIAVFR